MIRSSNYTILNVICSLYNKWEYQYVIKLLEFLHLHNLWQCPKKIPLSVIEHYVNPEFYYSNICIWLTKNWWLSCHSTKLSNSIRSPMHVRLITCSIELTSDILCWKRSSALRGPSEIIYDFISFKYRLIKISYL
jgi:hypothetical protein